MRRGLLLPPDYRKENRSAEEFPPKSHSSWWEQSWDLHLSPLGRAGLSKKLMPSPSFSHALERSLVRHILLTLSSLTQPCGDGTPPSRWGSLTKWTSTKCHTKSVFLGGGVMGGGRGTKVLFLPPTPRGSCFTFICFVC